MTQSTNLVDFIWFTEWQNYLRFTLSLVVSLSWNVCLNFLSNVLLVLFFVLLSVKNGIPCGTFFHAFVSVQSSFSFFVCETPPLLFVCSWLYRRRWESSSRFRAAFYKIGHAQPVLTFCGRRLRLHPCALLLALQLLSGSLQHTHICMFHILKSRCSAFVCHLADDLMLSTRISVRLLSEKYIWPLLLELVFSLPGSSLRLMECSHWPYFLLFHHHLTKRKFYIWRNRVCPNQSGFS